MEKDPQVTELDQGSAEREMDAAHQEEAKDPTEKGAEEETDGEMGAGTEEGYIRQVKHHHKFLPTHYLSKFSLFIT